MDSREIEDVLLAVAQADEHRKMTMHEVTSHDGLTIVAYALIRYPTPAQRQAFREAFDAAAKKCAPDG